MAVYSVRVYLDHSDTAPKKLVIYAASPLEAMTQAQQALGNSNARFEAKLLAKGLNEPQA